MTSKFITDATSPISHTEVRDYLCKRLNKLVKDNIDIVFLCIGSDRSTGDSLGPLVGHKTKHNCKSNIHMFGSLVSPIHSKNLEDILNKIYINYPNPFIIAIDSCLGNMRDIGKVFIEDGPLYPGSAINKPLPPVGDMNIKGIVNISGTLDFIVLQNTRLYTVMTIADSISKGINEFILKSLSNQTENINIY